VMRLGFLGAVILDKRWQFLFCARGGVMRTFGMLSGLALCLFAACALGGRHGALCQWGGGPQGRERPPPGIYFRNYEVWYHATQLKDRQRQQRVAHPRRHQAGASTWTWSRQ